MKIFCILSLLAAIMLPISSKSLVAPPDIEGADPLEEVYYRKTVLLGSEALVPVPTLQVIDGLKKLAGQYPQHPAYLKLLAAEEVTVERYEDAEAHIRAYVKIKGETEEVLSEAAAFYASRNKPEEQIQALRQAMHRSIHPAAEYLLFDQHPGYSYAKKILEVIDQKRPKGLTRLDILNELGQSFPSEPEARKLIHQELIKQKRTQELRAELQTFRRAFPSQVEYSFGLEAEILELEGLSDQARAFLDKNFQPLWPTFLIKRYYDLLKKDRNEWKRYISSLITRLSSNPEDADAVVRLFYAFQQDGNLNRALQILYEFHGFKEKIRMEGRPERKGTWSSTELYVWGNLFKQLGDFNEAARHFYGLYSSVASPVPLAGSGMWPVLGSTATPEEGLWQLFDTMIKAGNRPTQLGAGNMAFFRHIAMADRHPGLLNSILAIVLNRTDPADQYRRQEEKAIAYFNARRAESFQQIFSREFPKSNRLPSMEWEVLRLYSQYGAHEQIIRLGEPFLLRYTDKQEAGLVGLLLADAYKALERHEECWKTYDRLLTVLSRHSRGGLFTQKGKKEGEVRAAENRMEPVEEVPETSENSLSVDQRMVESGETNDPAAASGSKSSVDYEYVLQRYVSSLASAKQIPKAILIFRKEIEKYPAEAGLYERLAAFLEQHRLDKEVEAIYLRAIQQFHGAGWYDRLARWYLKRKMVEKFQLLSQQVVEVLQGSEIAGYMQDVVQKEPAGNTIYHRINLYAHQRFPHNLVFVHNLLRYYRQPKASAVTEWEKLARKYFFFDAEIQRQYLVRLAAQKQLEVLSKTRPAGEMTGATAGGEPQNPAEMAFMASASIWQSRFERAAPLLASLSSSWSGCDFYTAQHADLQRSMGAAGPGYYAQAAAVMEKQARIEPTRNAHWVKAGEIWADAGDMKKAMACWQRIAAISPGNLNNVVEAATVFWDYYLFDPAEGMILQYRLGKNDSKALFFELGAIYESRNEVDRAIDEYLHAFYPEKSQSYQAINRLSQLLEQKGIREKILQKALERSHGSQGLTFLTAFIRYLGGHKEDAAIIGLVESNLEALQKDSQAFQDVRLVLRSRRLNSCEENLLKEKVRTSRDMVETIETTAELAGFYEGGQNREEASRLWEKLIAQHPKNAGVIENSVAYFQRAGLYGKATSVLQQSIESANLSFKKQFLETLGRLYRQTGKYPEAERSWQSLLQLDPENMNAFHQLAEIYEMQKDNQNLVQLYKQIMAKLENGLAANQQEYREKIKAVRLKLIDIYTSLQESTSALDLFMELLNQQPEDLPLTNRAAALADAFNQGSRLTAFYGRQAARSDKDYRWPLLLARIYRRWGDRDQAAVQYAKAIAIQPNHNDAIREFISLLKALQRYDEAVAWLRKLHEQTYRRPEPLWEAAEITGCRGEIQSALSILEEGQRAASIPPTERWQKKAESLERWNQPEEAFRLAQDGLRWISSNPDEGQIDYSGLRSLTVSGMRVGRTVLLWENLVNMCASLPAEHPIRGIIANFLKYEFPRYLTIYANAHQLEALDDKIRSDWLSGRMENCLEIKNGLVAIAQTADLAFLEEWIRLQRLEEALKQDNPDLRDWHQARNSLEEFYRDHLQHGRLAKWLFSSFRRNGKTGLDPSQLPKIADNFRIAGLKGEEKEVLLQYARLGKRSEEKNSEAMIRLAEYLSETEDKTDLQNIASSVLPEDISLVNAFLYVNNINSSLNIINSFIPSLGQKWVSTQQAMIGWRSGIFPPEAQDQFRSLLRLETIGNRISKPSNPQSAWLGNEWFYLAFSYAQFQAGLKRKDPWKEDHLLMTNLEGYPHDTHSWLRTGEALLAADAADKGLRFFQQAVELQPVSYLYGLRWNVARFSLGQKESAIAGFRNIIEKQCSAEGFSARRLELRRRHIENTLQAAVKYGVLKELMESFKKFLMEAIRVQGHYGNVKMLEQLIPGIPTGQERDDFLKKLVLASPNPQETADYFFDSDLVSDNEKMQVLRSVADHLASQPESGDEWVRRNVQETLYSIRFRRIQFMLQTGAYSQAEEDLAAIKNQSHPGNWEPLRRMLMAESALRRKKPSEAAQVLKEWLTADKTTYGKNLEKIRELFGGFDAIMEAARVEEQYFQINILADNPSVEDFIGLLRALSIQKKRAEAKKLYDRMKCFLSFSIDATQAGEITADFHSAQNENWKETTAGIAEEAGDLDLALEVRQDLKDSLPPGSLISSENQQKYARILWKTDRIKEALGVVSGIIRDSYTPFKTKKDTLWMLYTEGKKKNVAAQLAEFPLDDRIEDAEIRSFLSVLSKTKIPASPTLPRYASLLDRWIIEQNDQKTNPKEIMDALLRLSYLFPDEKSWRPPMFTWCLEHGYRRFALELLDPKGAFEYAYIPPGKRAAASIMPSDEPEEVTANPFSDMGMRGGEAFSLIRKAFQAVVGERLSNRADYYGKLMIYYALEPPQLSAALSDLKKYRQEQEAQEEKKGKLWKVMEVLQLPPRPANANQNEMLSN